MKSPAAAPSLPLQRWFYLNRSLGCGRVFETYCDRMGIDLGAVKFLHKGNRVFGADTPGALQVGLACWVRSTGRDTSVELWVGVGS